MIGKGRERQGGRDDGRRCRHGCRKGESSLPLLQRSTTSPCEIFWADLYLNRSQRKS